MASAASKGRFDLAGRPGEELALLALAIGILGGVETALRRGHLSRDVIQCLFGDTPVERVAGYEVGVQVQATEQSIVVQHLLEMRHEPFRVNRIAVEAATELVVDAAIGHALQA